jgi:hypothetical protein
MEEFTFGSLGRKEKVGCVQEGTPTKILLVKVELE